MHRGFLYQHLYASACILVAERRGFRDILVERDEDIEIRTDEGRIYVQVKTRSGPLIPSDISSARTRFDQIRPRHADKGSDQSVVSGGRAGVPTFVVIANVPPGPGLSEQMESESWPADVTVVSPADSTSVDSIPPAWPDLATAFSWCLAEAEKIPYSRIAPDTLVWKLAALAQGAAAGGVGTSGQPRSFRTDDLPGLFEQVVKSLQEMPPPPEPYWPHEGEPTPVRDVPVRLIAAPTGAGKTAWASAAASHDSRRHAYFSAHGAEGDGFVPALVRELAARFAGNDDRDISSVIMPGRTGLDALRALTFLLQEDGSTPVVVLDDVQVLEPSAVVTAIKAAPPLRWILLGQPGPTVDRIAASLALEVEALDGWGLPTIAAALTAEGCPADALTCERVQTLTGGLPLFVRNLATTASKTNTPVATLCDQLERGDHLQRTTQELLLADTLSALADSERILAENLGIAGISLDPSEIAALAEASGISSKSVAQGLRNLIARGVARRLTGDQVRIHDAFRVLCNGTGGTVNVATVRAVKKRLVDILAAGMPTHSVERAGKFLELLPAVGATEQLVEIVGSESDQLHELGLAPRLNTVLTQLAADTEADPGARFWALDALAFWAIQEGREEDAHRFVAELNTVAGKFDLDQRQEMTLLVKNLLLAGAQGDLGSAREFYDEIVRSSEDDELVRVARYDYAIALFGAEEFGAAAEVALELSRQYYDVVGLTPQWVYRKNPPEIAEKLSGSSQVRDDLKRLADCLDLFARARRAQGLGYGLSRIYATKFYTVAGWYRSAIRSGQEVVDDMLAMGDLPEARSFMEQTLIPSVTDLKLIDYLVPVRAQYAVILAYCGEIVEARAEITTLRSFRATSQLAQEELESQAALIEAIAAGDVRAPPRRELPPAPPELPVPRIATAKKVGRNDACPCGSGRKFKKCCGP